MGAEPGTALARALRAALAGPGRETPMSFLEVFSPGMQHLREERDRRKMLVVRPAYGGGGTPLGIDLEAGTATFARPQPKGDPDPGSGSGSDDLAADSEPPAEAEPAEPAEPVEPAGLAEPAEH